MQSTRQETTPSGRFFIEALSDKALELLGIEGEELEKAKAILQEVHEKGKASDYSFEVSMPDGTTRNLLVNAFTVHSEKGEPRAMASVVRDIT